MIECDQIEDYLSGELAEVQAKEFQRHTMNCDLCQSHLEAHSEFQRLVVESKDRFERLSQGCQADIRLAVGSRRKSRQYRRTGLIVSCGIAASIAIVFALSQLYLNESQQVAEPGKVESADPVKELATNLPPRQATISQKTTPVSISLSDDSGYLAVPVDSTSPDVTIFWLHPTVEPTVSNDSSNNPQNPETLFARR